MINENRVHLLAGWLGFQYNKTALNGKKHKVDVTLKTTTTTLSVHFIRIKFIVSHFSLLYLST